MNDTAPSGLTIAVASDIAPLQQVIVHRPDFGIESVTPSNAKSLLYDDIVFLKHMQSEHDVFTEVLAAFVGSHNVLELQNMLAEVLSAAPVREAFTRLLTLFEGLPHDVVEQLKALDASALAGAVITGIHPYSRQAFMLAIPNLIFTRDVGAVINDYVLTGHHSKKPRKRESLITWFVLHHHPVFAPLKAAGKYVDLSADSDQLLAFLNQEEGGVSVEGGDVMVLAADHLLIAKSERTSEAGIHAIIEQLFAKNIVSKVSVAQIPQEHFCMHIDTILTQISTNDYVVYAPIIFNAEKGHVTQYNKGTDAPKEFDTIKDLLVDMNPEVNFILCGGGQPTYDEREQWTSGCNFVALKSGVAITYERNYRTMEALEAQGYRIIAANDLLREFKHGTSTPESTENTIITITAHELSRGGGGPHCLTFPISRG